MGLSNVTEHYSGQVAVDCSNCRLRVLADYRVTAVVQDALAGYLPLSAEPEGVLLCRFCGMPIDATEGMTPIECNDPNAVHPSIEQIMQTNSSLPEEVVAPASDSSADAHAMALLRGLARAPTWLAGSKRVAENSRGAIAFASLPVIGGIVYALATLDLSNPVLVASLLVLLLVVIGLLDLLRRAFAAHLMRRAMFWELGPVIRRHMKCTGLTLDRLARLSSEHQTAQPVTTFLQWLRTHGCDLPGAPKC